MSDWKWRKHRNKYIHGQFNSEWHLVAFRQSAQCHKMIYELWIPNVAICFTLTRQSCGLIGFNHYTKTRDVTSFKYVYICVSVCAIIDPKQMSWFECGFLVESFLMWADTWYRCDVLMPSGNSAYSIRLLYVCCIWAYKVSYIAL